MHKRKNTIKGHNNLAAELGVSPRTVQRWNASGILAPAVLSRYGRVVIYDLDKVFECLNHQTMHQHRNL